MIDDRLDVLQFIRHRTEWMNSSSYLNRKYLKKLDDLPIPSEACNRRNNLDMFTHITTIWKPESQTELS